MTGRGTHAQTPTNKHSSTSFAHLVSCDSQSLSPSIHRSSPWARAITGRGIKCNCRVLMSRSFGRGIPAGGDMPSDMPIREHRKQFSISPPWTVVRSMVMSGPPFWHFDGFSPPPGPLHNVGCSGLFCVKLKLTSGPGPRDSDHIPNRARNHSDGGTAFELPASRGGFWGSGKTPSPAGQSPFDGITQANHRPAFLHPLVTQDINHFGWIGLGSWNPRPPGETARPFAGTRSIGDLTPLRDSLVLAVRKRLAEGVRQGCSPC